MSRFRTTDRVACLFAAGALFTLVACASRGATGSNPDPRPSARDTSVLDTEGKSLEALFTARFPGVVATRTDGGGLKLRIRGGASTFMGGGEPLILVDGMALPQDSRATIFLNPNDIEKIEVLKNPQDTAIYGIRGGNGVIRITTKKPGRR